jgi:eukaryotic-like serine/threonine-protein kinase
MERINERYEIIRPLGEGGMANVYLAQDTILNREVAVKVLRGEMATDALALLRFQREANAAATLSHPNIVTIYDVGNDKNKHYIVMEYIKGQTLKQLLGRRGALHVAEAIYVMKQLTSAVEAAHEKGIIHRDIKPQNVMIKDDGTIKITDFGIAMAQDALQLTISDAVMGSVHYLAPELARGEAAKIQSDIYSLGIVLYELLVGDVPFRADTPVQVALKHLREEVPMVRDVNPGIPQAVENIIIKATAKNKVNRYANCQELLADLEQCEKSQVKERLVFTQEEQPEDRTIQAPKLESVTPNEDKMKKTKKKNWFVSLATILISFLLVAISIIAIVAILMLAGVVKAPKRQVVLPDLVNMSAEQATIELDKLNLYLSPSVVREMSDTVPAGQIISMEPSAGSKLLEGSSVNVVISEGIWFVVPDYKNRNFDEVQSEITNQQLKFSIRVEHQIDPKVAEGTILKQDGLMPGDKINPSRQYEIRFFVAGVASFNIPNVVGMDIGAAQVQIKNLGGTVKIVQKSTAGLTPEEIAKIQYGKVVEVKPGVGSAYKQGEKNSITLYYY